MDLTRFYVSVITGLFFILCIYDSFYLKYRRLVVVCLLLLALAWFKFGGELFFCFHRPGIDFVVEQKQALEDFAAGDIV
jgi:hypothetical protein